jgi:hypothetical protein
LVKSFPEKPVLCRLNFSIPRKNLSKKSFRKNQRFVAHKQITTMSIYALAIAATLKGTLPKGRFSAKSYPFFA